MSETPDKYQPEPRDWECKAYLYRKYWGELLPVREIADECGVAHSMIRTAMRDNGIPTRVDGYQRRNSVSPFAGFYRDQAARTDEQSRQHFEPDHESQQPDEDFEWSFTDYSNLEADD